MSAEGRFENSSADRAAGREERNAAGQGREAQGGKAQGGKAQGGAMQNREIRDEIIGHYSGDGRARRLLRAAMENAADPARLTLADLSAYDELHVGGRDATDRLLARLDLQPGMRVLDIGSGLGGPARHAAAHYGVTVAGIDLTPEYGEVASVLTEKTGLADKVSFVTASALALPYDGAAFDAAYTIHTAMNIADRAGLYREARRVLKAGAAFGVYDICVSGRGLHPAYPVPWASDRRASHLCTPDETMSLLAAAGFAVTGTEDAASDGLKALRARAAREGERVSPKIANLLRAMEDGICIPWYAVCRAI